MTLFLTPQQFKNGPSSKREVFFLGAYDAFALAERNAEEGEHYEAEADD